MASMRAVEEERAQEAERAIVRLKERLAKYKRLAEGTQTTTLQNRVKTAVDAAT
jgi:DNA-binding protein H-NS